MNKSDFETTQVPEQVSEIEECFYRRGIGIGVFWSVAIFLILFFVMVSINKGLRNEVCEAKGGTRFESKCLKVEEIL